MKRQIAIIGLGRFGTSLAETLSEMGHDVLAVDIKEKTVQDIASHVTQAVQADATDEESLKEMGIGDLDVAIVAIGGSTIGESVLATILLKRLGVKFVIARAENQLHGVILEKVGADRVVYPEREMGMRVAHAATLPDVLDYMSVAHSYGVAKIESPPYFIGKKLHDLGFGHGGELGTAVLMIQRGTKAIVTPDRWEVVTKDDILIVAGSDDRLEQLLIKAQGKINHDGA